jgi:capsular polysaccharide biosynthesis protein
LWAPCSPCLAAFLCPPPTWRPRSLPCTHEATRPAPLAIPPHLVPGSDDSTIDAHVTVLLSEAYLRRLLPALRALDGAGHDSARSFFRTIWSKSKELLFIGQRQPSDGRAAAALKGPLKASQERRSRIISVIYTDADPKRAADVANLVARSYVDELLRQKQAVEAQALDVIAVQSAAVQRDLSKAQVELDASRLGQTSPSQRAALEWQMTTLAQQFETLLRRRQELTTKGAGTEPEVTLIAEASPADLPSSLNPFLLVPPITIAFALLACLLAVILHRFDRTLRTEAEAAEALRIPCAGLIPSIPRELSRQPRRILEQPAIAYTRAIRSTVVSLLASDPVASQSQRIVLVTSSIRGEGKSAVSWSFGFYAAQLGQHVRLRSIVPSTRRRHRRSIQSVGARPSPCRCDPTHPGTWHRLFVGRIIRRKSPLAAGQSENVFAVRAVERHLRSRGHQCSLTAGRAGSKTSGSLGGPCPACCPRRKHQSGYSTDRVASVRSNWGSQCQYPVLVSPDSQIPIGARAVGYGTVAPVDFDDALPVAEGGRGTMDDD